MMQLYDHLNLIKSYIVVKSWLNNLIEKALPVGTIRNRKSGKYKKMESGKWVRVRNPKTQTIPMPSNFEEMNKNQKKKLLDFVKNEYSKDEIKNRIKEVDKIIQDRNNYLDKVGVKNKKKDIKLSNYINEKKLYEQADKETEPKEKPKSTTPQIKKWTEVEHPGKMNIKGNFWNGQIYGNERYGYKIYVDNKEVKLNPQQKEYISMFRNEIQRELAKNKAVDPIEKKKEIDRWMGYLNDAAKKGYIYQKGLDKLKELGADKDENTKKELSFILDKVKAKKEEQIKNAPKYVVHTLSTFPGLNKPVKHGDKLIVYEKAGNPFTINEDTPSLQGGHLLGHEGEKGQRYYYREATEKEKNQYEEEQNHLKQKKEKQLKLRADISNIENEIKTKGEIPHSKEGQLSIKGDRYLDTQDIYGSGSWFEITPDSIWFIENNGMDGDNWSRNNVRTGGAGAIGYKIPYSKEIENKIKELHNEHEKSKEE